MGFVETCGSDPCGARLSIYTNDIEMLKRVPEGIKIFDLFAVGGPASDVLLARTTARSGAVLVIHHLVEPSDG